MGLSLIIEGCGALDVLSDERLRNIKQMICECSNSMKRTLVFTVPTYVTGKELIGQVFSLPASFHGSTVRVWASAPYRLSVAFRFFGEEEGTGHVYNISHCYGCLLSIGRGMLLRCQYCQRAHNVIALGKCIRTRLSVRCVRTRSPLGTGTSRGSVSLESPQRMPEAGWS